MIDICIKVSKWRVRFLCEINNVEWVFDNWGGDCIFAIRYWCGSPDARRSGLVEQRTIIRCGSSVGRAKD